MFEGNPASSNTKLVLQATVTITAHGKQGAYIDPEGMASLFVLRFCIALLLSQYTVYSCHNTQCIVAQHQ